MSALRSVRVILMGGLIVFLPMFLYLLATGGESQSEANNDVFLIAALLGIPAVIAGRWVAHREARGIAQGIILGLITALVGSLYAVPGFFLAIYLIKSVFGPYAVLLAFGLGLVVTVPAGLLGGWMGGRS